MYARGIEHRRRGSQNVGQIIFEPTSHNFIGLNKYLVSGPPKTESSFEIGGSINLEHFEEGKRGYVSESTHSVSKVMEAT